MLLHQAISVAVLVGGLAGHAGTPDAVVAFGAPTASAATDTIPEDTYADPDVHDLVEAAKAARAEEREGIESYEARAWQRVWGGMDSERFRRSRSLFQREKAGHIRWEADGRRVVRWDGAFQEVPVAGVRSDRDASMADNLSRSLAEAVSFQDPFFPDPGRDRFYLWGDEDWVLHPLADTAQYHYRYRSGDTVRVTLPEGRTVTIVEAVVEPRRSDYRLLAGSLWFDAESAELVRASYRAARPFNLGMDADDDVPRLLRNIEAEVRSVTVDYSFHELEWWLPRRHAVTVEVRAGDLVRVPVTLEWSAEDYRVNEPQSAELVPDSLPPGWTHESGMRPAPDAEEVDGEPADSVEWVSVVPPADSLHLSPRLRLAARGGSPAGREVEIFTPEELEALEEALDDLVPRRAVFQPRLRYGIQDGMVRYNRVEGLSAAVAGEVPLTPLGRNLSGWAKVRLGVADLEPGGEVGIQRGSAGRTESVVVYRRLEDTSDWDDFLNLSSSISALVAGSDRGEYYRTHGVEARLAREVPGLRLRGRLFAEAHRAAEKNTDFTLRGLVGSDRFRPNLEAEEGTWYGGSLELRGHRGFDTAGLRLFGTVRGETAWNDDASYRRFGGSAGGSVDAGPVDVALEGGAGRTWGQVPVQRHFFLGGPSTLRGVRLGSVSGASYWFGRTEVARGWPAFRAGLFTDVGWAGPTEALGSGSPVTTVGLGLSMMDGIMRTDLAYRLTDDGAFRLHVYLDGLF